MHDVNWFHVLVVLEFLLRGFAEPAESSQVCSYASTPVPNLLISCTCSEQWPDMTVNLDESAAQSLPHVDVCIRVALACYSLSGQFALLCFSVA